MRYPLRIELHNSDSWCFDLFIGKRWLIQLEHTYGIEIGVHYTNRILYLSFIKWQVVVIHSRHDLL